MSITQSRDTWIEQLFSTASNRINLVPFFLSLSAARPQVLDEDELLVNRIGMVAGAVGNTLSQIFFGTNELRSEVTFWCANR